MHQLELFDAKLFEIQEGSRLHNGYPDHWVEVWREYDDGSLFYWEWGGNSGYTSRQRLADEGYAWICQSSNNA